MSVPAPLPQGEITHISAESLFLSAGFEAAAGWPLRAQGARLHVSPSGSADYVAHRPEQLPFTIRWISRTPDQDCLGFAMPATAEPEGYSAEKAKGHLQAIAGATTWRADFVVGTLDHNETTQMRAQIDQIS
jgi:hypothetical protein